MDMDDFLEMFHVAKEGLTERELFIVYHRIGWGGRKRLTLAALGKTFGISRERVRQIEKNALKKIKAKMVAPTALTSVAMRCERLLGVSA